MVECNDWINVTFILLQVVNLTKELLAEAEQQQQHAVSAAAAAAAPASTEAPEQPASSTLPPTVAQQIKLAQQRAALAGHGSPEWALGAEVQAKYSGDGLWYDATITGVDDDGNFIVTFNAYGIQEVVLRHDIRQNAALVQAGGIAAASDYKGKTWRKKIYEKMPRLKISLFLSLLRWQLFSPYATTHFLLFSKNLIFFIFTSMCRCGCS